MAKDFERKYLADFVYGGIDGAITTFAIVAGVIGASLDSLIIIILGFANLFADGFSMATSNYLSTKSQNEVDSRQNRKKIDAKDPKKTALATLVFFLIVGFIPLLSFVVAPVSPFLEENKFFISFLLTGAALFIVGAFKGKIIGKHWLKSAFETLFIGGIAAFIAYIVGAVLKEIIGI